MYRDTALGECIQNLDISLHNNIIALYYCPRATVIPKNLYYLKTIDRFGMGDGDGRNCRWVETARLKGIPSLPSLEFLDISWTSLQVLCHVLEI